MEQELMTAYLRGISEIAGIPFSQLETYASTNSPFNILEHPRLLELTEKQYQKVEQLNQFLRAYGTLELEKEMPNGFDSSERVGKWFQSMMGNMKDYERMAVAFVDEKMNLITVKTLAEGTVNEAPVYPRQFLRHALEIGASGIFVCHNHPSGSELPSGPDLDVTTRLQKTLEPMGILLHDHIIVTERSYTSLREAGIIQTPRQNLQNMDNSPMNPDKSGSLQQCIIGMASLIGVAEGKLMSHARGNGPFFILQSPESIPLTPKQYQRMSIVSEFQKLWQDAIKNRPLNQMLGSSSNAGLFAMQQVGLYSNPTFLAIYLNSQNQLIETSVIPWKSGLIDPKTIIARAIASDCNAIILARNTEEIHPTVMDDDRRLAHRVSTALHPMNIQLVDYMIASNSNYISLAETGFLSFVVKENPNLDICTLSVKESTVEIFHEDMEM